MYCGGNINLAGRLRSSLPGQIISLLEEAGSFCHRRGEKLFLVGGAVRDLLLGQPGRDIDLVIEGDAVSLAQKLSREIPAVLTCHGRFKTARLSADDLVLDIATARREVYSQPGALPRVKTGTLTEDLKRRDFSINAMALALSGPDYGWLFDPLEGRTDLERGIIRVLHPGSFKDDATRLFRAVRYEQRFAFCIEPRTLQYLTRDKGFIATISSDRLQYEFSCILQEKYPEKSLARAAGLSLLTETMAGLAFSQQQAGWFEAARLRYQPQLPPLVVCYLLLALPLGHTGRERLKARLNLPAQISRAIRDAGVIWDKLELLSSTTLLPAGVCNVLDDLVLEAIEACLIASGAGKARENMGFYLENLRHIKPQLDGDELLSLGVPPGPQVGKALKRLRIARLNGLVNSRQSELIWSSNGYRMF
jgi:tRNA nucleotidyltransferase (CCA-adding enzyme)